MHLRGLAGKTVEVLIERTGSGQGMIGCTPHFAKMPLFAIKDRPLTLDALVGQIVPARITVAENGAVIAHFAGRQ
jgi:tRNA A37 methylthiotransferase MiaB